MGSTGLGGTPWTALTIRSPAVLTNKERHPPCANSPVFKTILTERPRAAVFLRLFRNNLLPFDPDLESIEDDDDYDDEVDDDDDDVDEVWWESPELKTAAVKKTTVRVEAIAIALNALTVSKSYMSISDI